MRTYVIVLVLLYNVYVNFYCGVASGTLAPTLGDHGRPASDCLRHPTLR
jgi:hypothetical protein